MEKHIKLTPEFKINVFGIKLFRIEATRNSKHAKKGDLGGWVESTENISGNAWVFGDAIVSGDARVSGNAEIESNNDYCCFQSFGSENRTTTFFKEKENKIKVNCGCFNGSIEDFEKQVLNTHKDSKYAKEYLAILEVVKIKFNL